MKAITDKTQIEQEIAFVLEFGRDQMVFLSRRGTIAQRKAALAVARRLPKMASRLRRELIPVLMPDKTTDLPPAA